MAGAVYMSRKFVHKMRRPRLVTNQGNYEKSMCNFTSKLN